MSVEKVSPDFAMLTKGFADTMISKTKEVIVYWKAKKSEHGGMRRR